MRFSLAKLSRLASRRTAALPRAAVAATRLLCTEPPKEAKSMTERMQSATGIGQSATERFHEVRERGGGIMDAAWAGKEKQDEERKEENFLEFQARLLSMPKFDMHDFKLELQQILSQADESKMGYLQRARLKLDTARGGTFEQTIQDIKERTKLQLAIVDSFTASEMCRPGLVRYDERERIAQKLGLENHAEIKELMERYSMVQMQWEWICREHRAGRPLPKDQDEISWMIRQRPTAQFTKLMKNNQKRKMTVQQKKTMIPLFNGKKRRKNGSLKPARRT